MATGEAFYRGGTSLKTRPFEVKLDPFTGLLRPMYGISVFNRLGRFGRAYRAIGVPEKLKIIQRGHDPSHFEVVPARPMTLAEYEATLGKIVLVSS